MSFTVNNKQSFIDSFQFLNSSLDSLVKNLSIDDFKYLCQEFDNNVLNLVNQKDFVLMSIWLILKSLKKYSLAKKSFIVFTDKEYEDVLNVSEKIKMNAMKDYHDLYLKCDVLLLADVFEKFGNNSLKIMDYAQVNIWAHHV